MPTLLANHAVSRLPLLTSTKLSLAPNPLGTVLHRLRGTISPNPWIVFHWIKDIKRVTELFCYLTGETGKIVSMLGDGDKSQTD